MALVMAFFMGAWRINVSVPRVMKVFGKIRTTFNIVVIVIF